jgi:casein kinase I homolog HRR25
MSLTNIVQDLRVGNKYRIGRKIGSGSFGDIYLGMYSIFQFSLLTKADLAQAQTLYQVKRLPSSSKV